MAAAGSQQAQGTLNRLDTIAQLRREWKFFLGQTGLSPTVKAFRTFVGKYGITLSDMGADSSRLSSDQVEAFLTQAAVGMIQAGAVNFEAG